MFGISLTEIVVIAMIALIFVGPQKLPGMLRTIGQWMRKLRRLTTEVRAQTGIDEILREEGIDGVHELRSLLRGEIRAARQQQRHSPADDPYRGASTFDNGREYPPEGPDAYAAVPEDLMEQPEEEAAPTSANAPVPAAETDPSSPPQLQADPAPAAAAPAAPPRPLPSAPPRSLPSAPPRSLPSAPPRSLPSAPARPLPSAPPRPLPTAPPGPREPTGAVRTSSDGPHASEPPGIPRPSPPRPSPTTGKPS